MAMADSTQPKEEELLARKRARSAYEKAYYQANKDRILQRSREYAEKNADRIRESRKAYYKANRDRLREQGKAAAKRRAKADRVRETAWRKRNKDRVREYNLRYVKKKLSTDYAFWLRQRVRVRLCGVLNNREKPKSGRTIAYVGCDIDTLVAHIESQFTDGMSWDNRGKWHIDHIIPLALFDLRDEKQQLAAFNYKNLRPMWAMDNVKKGAKPPEPQRMFGFAYAARITAPAKTRKKK
jgi:hypothetical protein